MKKQGLSNSSEHLNFSVIIPNYNGSQYVIDCLNSLSQAIKQYPKSKFELIFVDNGSIDNSCQLFNDYFKQNKFSNLTFKIDRLKSNFGFAGAVNRGIKQSQHPWVVLLNNDLTMEPNWFQIISKEIQKNLNSKIITFFGTVLTKDGTKFESQGLKYYFNGKCKNISNGKPFSSKALKLHSSNSLVWGASASLIVYKKEIIKKIGLFDDDFFAYEEDVDLAFRLNKLGYKTLYIPKAISYHLGGGTSNKMANFRNRMDAKNWIYLIIKNYSASEFWGNFGNIFVERLRNFSGLAKSTINKYHLKSILYLPYDITRTYGEVILKLPKMLIKRHQIKKLVKYHN